MGLILDIFTTMYVVTQRGMVSRACWSVIWVQSHPYSVPYLFWVYTQPPVFLRPAMFLTLYWVPEMQK